MNNLNYKNNSKKINVFSRDLGWLFKDLQDFFAFQGALVSEEPILDCNRWICIRTSEAYKTPDIKRTIVQVHDFYAYDIDFFNNAFCIIFTHPAQYEIWKKTDF